MTPPPPLSSAATIITFLTIIAATSPPPLRSTSSTLAANNGEALCWRFPSPEVAWKFRTITSGGGFSCGILTNNSRVVCWGESEIGDEIQREFGNLTMWSIVAGVSHACGLTQTGILICKGSNSSGLLDVPSHLPFEFEGIAMGSNHSCAIQSKNGLVLCWGGGSRRSEFVRDELKYESFEAIEAGLDFICGLTTKNLSVICWGPGWSNGLSLLPLPMAIPGPCVQSSSCSICGVYPNSDSLCAGSGIICKSSSLKCQNSRTLRRQRSGTSTSSKQADRVEKFSLTELGVATNNFSPENKIGRGSFGTVYRGELADGRKVAIKRGEIGARMKKLREKETAFDSELALLSRLHHKHLVELVGFCQETDERLLVYEHMSNGSLHDNLHNTNNIENRCSVLNSWRMRIKIALDAARGIDYLHNYAVPPIIHRDIKSSNILLDVNWTAKVSDFGLSLMGPEPDQESMSSKAVGTVGYIDPEYYVLNILTVKSDVYGLGVVLLELLTGKRAVFKEGLCPMGVVEYAVPLIAAGELDSVLDKRVAPPDVREAEAVELVAYIAKHCVKLQGWERPSITDIVVNLERALALCEGGISSPTCYIDNSQ
ncbi:hypothetical protein TEA_004977 [Camellia sinensis var. sinensis]|uniref:Protein kinase domain-containing protein n=1 Tax=Camellia sinensis var. sinensis TaxID=542762 RepID=A0A4S4EDZ0_CAMSN|nr:hypothetical protein TEA_004977 [Camellia sinensis var. sinensis]